MFRDDVLKEMMRDRSTHSGDNLIMHSAMIEEIKRAKALHLDQNALALVNTYANEIGDDGCSTLLRSVPISWPSLWLEHEEQDEDGVNTYGALLVQDKDYKTCNIFMRHAGQKGIHFSHRSLYCPLGSNEPMRAFANQFEIANTLEYGDNLERTHPTFDKGAIRLMERASVLSTLLLNSRLLDVTTEKPISTIKRQQFRKAGETPPRANVQKIDLTDLGRVMYKMRVLGEEPEVEGQTGKRRAHWVRDHMFMARNGVLTYRKAHIRGMGKLVGGKAAITASDDSPSP